MGEHFSKETGGEAWLGRLEGEGNTKGSWGQSRKKLRKR